MKRMSSGRQHITDDASIFYFQPALNRLNTLNTYSKSPALLGLNP